MPQITILLTTDGHVAGMVRKLKHILCIFLGSGFTCSCITCVATGILENRGNNATAQVSSKLAPQSNRRSITVQEDLKEPLNRGQGGGCCG